MIATATRTVVGIALQELGWRLVKQAVWYMIKKRSRAAFRVG